jgi:hypothetical protein
MSVKDVFLEWVFPLLGGIVGTLMFMAPLRAVLEGESMSPRRIVDQPTLTSTLHDPFVAARKRRELGPLNPVPYPTQAANSIAWIAYAYGTSAAASASASRSCRFHPDAHPDTLDPIPIPHSDRPDQ